MSTALRRSSRVALLTVLTLVLALVRASAAPAAVVPASLSTDMAKAAASLPGDTRFGAFVHTDGIDTVARADLLAGHGLSIATDFPSVDASYVVAPLSALLDLRNVRGVTHLEADRTLAYLGDTAPWTTGARVARTAVGNGPYTVDGKVIDGSGVGVAVVDSGVDGTHPDLATHLGKVYKVACGTPGLVNTTTGQCFGPAIVQETPPAAAFTDNTGGHGTHVSGIAVGDGTASKGTFQGVAPKATLFSYGVGETLVVLYAAEAFQHMLTNYDTFTPRIKVVNNSWGDAAGSAFDPADVLSKLTAQLVGKGVTMVYAAGNGDSNGDGGTGADDRLSSTAKDPTPGVITVANYDDGGVANRNGALDSSSSRGKKGVPTDYPDISAPGSLITSTCNAALPVCRLEVVPTVAWAPRYATISGTSMASPHIAGSAALLYQAKPTITPAEVEKVLQDTAYKYSTPGAPYEVDPQNPGGTTSFDKGAGLLDVPAALDALGVTATNRPPVGTPAITTTTPAAGTVNDGTAPVQVTGTVNDGILPAPALTSVSIASGDANDLPAPYPGAADLSSMSFLEKANGIEVTVGVRNVAEAGPSNPSLRLFYNVTGVARTTGLTLASGAATAAAYSATTNSVVATNITRDVTKNTVTFLLPFAGANSLCEVAAGELVTDIRMWSYGAITVDQLPGGIGAAGLTAPEYGTTFALRRPGLTTPPVTTVTVAVDGGQEQPATLTGSSPNYGFEATVDTTGLVDGQHTLVSRLYLNGVATGSSSTPFSVVRPRVITSSIDIASPTEGTTVNRGVVTVSGTAASDAPATQVRSVQLQVSGPGYAPAPVTANGTSAWSTPVDFSSLPAGSYVLTATLLLDGAAVSTASRTVVLPVATPPATLVSCTPQALKFWQNEYSGGAKPAFTATERSAIATKAAELSQGYFADARTVTTTLYAAGKITTELAAAKEYAPLVLDLAAGQLSNSYSRRVGLSGAEGLKPSGYDSRVGTTVGSAAAWIRAQLGSGDLSTAGSTAKKITRGDDLSCTAPAGTGAGNEHEND
ncbi:MAG: S8 family serine peptidase [Mycobacteriales bacterium]